jgi:DNA-binding transcriptional ArsR family regulator
VTIIARPDDVRRQNQFSILAALRRHGNLSRTELSAATGLSASTVTVISSSLMERGVLTAEETGEQSGQKRGRPQVRLLPNPRFASIAVMRLALNQISADIHDYSGNVLTTRTARVRTREMTGGDDRHPARSAG